LLFGTSHAAGLGTASRASLWAYFALVRSSGDLNINSIGDREIKEVKEAEAFGDARYSGIFLGENYKTWHCSS
jgi:hypothetical protein